MAWVTEEDQSLKPLVGSFALWTVPAAVLRARSGSGMRRAEEQRGGGGGKEGGRPKGRYRPAQRLWRRGGAEGGARPRPVDRRRRSTLGCIADVAEFAFIE